MSASIRRGLYLLRFTPESLPKYATSSLRCTSCHQNDGLKATSAPLTGSHARCNDSADAKSLTAVKMSSADRFVRDDRRGGRELK